MTIETPTNPDGTGELGKFLASLADEATLTRLASEFFSLLPQSQSASGVPGSLPVSPQGQIPSSRGLPAVVDSPSSVAPTGVPDTLSQSVSPLPTSAGPSANPQLGVPEAYAASLPNVDLPGTPTAPASGSPYYFIEAAAAYSPAPNADFVTAQPYALPGADHLSSLLAQVSVGFVRNEVPATLNRNPNTTGHFYFLDPAGHPSSHVPATAQPAPSSFDVHLVRRDFPALRQKVHGKPLIWLDSAATSQKPQSVIDAISYFYENDNSNIHRAAHALAARATDAYEGARQKIQHFLGAASPDEIIFVRGTTEGINLLAQTCGRQRIGPGDEIVVTQIEHHANIVPWQLLAKEKGATLKVVPINDRGEILLHEYEKLLGPKTRIVALTHVSNTLGTVVPVELMTAMAHQHGAAVVVDGAQSVPHFRLNVQAIGCDFLVFSGHKLYGPTGIGALYGKKSLLEEMPPWQGGGNMIDHVTFENTTYNKVPYKFEAGTGHIGGAVGLGAAIDYVNRIGFEAAAHYEDGLLAYATEGLSTIPGLRLFGNAMRKVGTLSFVLEGTRPEDVGKLLDKEGIAVRAGHHCAQPTMQRFGVTGMVRPSLAFYNTYEEIDTLIRAIYKIKKTLS